MDLSSASCKYCSAAGTVDQTDPVTKARGLPEQPCEWSEHLPDGTRKGALCAYCAALHRTLYVGTSRVAMTHQIQHNIDGMREKHVQMRKLLIEQWVVCDNEGKKRRFLPKHRMESLSHISSTKTELKPMSKTLLYTPSAYMAMFGRSHEADGLPLRSITSASGHTTQMVAVQDGPKGVFELTTSEVQDVQHSKVLDDGTEQLHGLQVADSFKRAVGATNAATSFADLPCKQDLLKRPIASTAASSSAAASGPSTNGCNSEDCGER